MWHAARTNIRRVPLDFDFKNNNGDNNNTILVVHWGLVGAPSAKQTRHSPRCGRQAVAIVARSTVVDQTGTILAMTRIAEDKAERVSWWI